MDKHTQAAARLKAWITDNGRKSSWVATQLNISEGMLSRWVTGRSYPAMSFRAAINTLTDGAVKAADWE